MNNSHVNPEKYKAITKTNHACVTVTEKNPKTNKKQTQNEDNFRVKSAIKLKN